MPKYRAKPIEVTAEQWTTDSKPDSVTVDSPGYGFVTGKQGRVACAIGDFIITETDGSGFYPCASDIFKAKYEAIGAYPGAEPQHPVPMERQETGHQVSKLTAE